MTAIAKLGLLACFCGRIGFDPRGDGGDGDGTTDGQDSCGQVVFSDDFGDGVVDARWMTFADPGYTVAETGELQITYADSVGSDLYGGYGQVMPIDIGNGCMRARLVTMPNPATSAFAFVRLGTSTDKIQFAIGGGQLYAYAVNANVATILEQVAFDPINHQWVQFRVTDAALMWETSPNGRDWTFLVGLLTELSSFNTGTATIEIAAGTNSQGATNAGFVAWGDVAELLP